MTNVRASSHVAVPRREAFTWNALLWGLIAPQRSHRIVPTIPGTVLVALSFGIGMAAYNASSNILFLTLSLLLTCLVLSGVLSWLNFRGVRWELQLASALRAGHDTLVTVKVANRKAFLPTYGLGFNLRARPRRPAGEQRPESTLTARSDEIRIALAQAAAGEIHGRALLEGRLDPASATQLEWVFQPTRRGLLRVELLSVGSLFPFGFLRKEVGVALGADVVVWPAPIEYQRHTRNASARQAGNERVARAGSGSDLLAVRRYAPGDSHRLIHWKASARTRQLLVRQFAAETAQRYAVWLRTEAEVWPRADQFEVLVSFAATLTEDLFRSGRLDSVTIDDAPTMAIRGLRDLELCLDALALVAPRSPARGAAPQAPRGNLLTFSPEGARAVAAWVGGQRIASA